MPPVRLNEMNKNAIISHFGSLVKFPVCRPFLQWLLAGTRGSNGS